ncbi:MAG: hypothetical protein ABT14_14365 [Pelagibacterium sp. SCN 63-17]|nr:MAG: hypothetical protein ABT14_14365 [Pelagibacterium sp. SCN 63-17]
MKAAEEQIFAPDRLIPIVQAMTDRTDDTRQQLESEIDRQRAAVADIQSRLGLRCDAIEAGLAELGGARVKQRIDLAKIQIRKAQQISVHCASALKQRRRFLRRW